MPEQYSFSDYPITASVLTRSWGREIAVSIPNNPPFIGEADEDKEGGVFLYTLYVEPDLRRQGIATRLMSAMALVAKNEGYSSLYSAIDSPHTARILKRLFPEQSVKFHDNDPVLDSEVVLPITYDQAIQSLERLVDCLGEESSFGFGFEVNLGQVALAEWQDPNFIQKP